MSRKLTVAIAGVTGAVGQEFIHLLEKSHWPIGALKFLASARSVGKTVTFKGQAHKVEELTEQSLRGVDIALFSAGGSISKVYGPICRKLGVIMIDNSSAFRMDPTVPLVVPEVNPEAAFKHDKIIANPNCSTIIMNVPVWPLHRAFGVRRLVISTYQAVSGAGQQAMLELEEQTREFLAGKPLTKKVLPHQIAFNLFSHTSKIGADGYNEEETKMVKETHKIFSEPSIGITATCVRVPILRSHTESINIEFKQGVSEAQVREVLASAPGVKLVDDRDKNYFPMPIETSGQGLVYVGRIRHDASVDGQRGINLLVCGDQLLKGAALNAVQIGDLLVAKGL